MCTFKQFENKRHTQIRSLKRVSVKWFYLEKGVLQAKYTRVQALFIVIEYNLYHVNKALKVHNRAPL